MVHDNSIYTHRPIEIIPFMLGPFFHRTGKKKHRDTVTVVVKTRLQLSPRCQLQQATERLAT